MLLMWKKINVSITPELLCIQLYNNYVHGIFWNWDYRITPHLQIAILGLHPIWNWDFGIAGPRPPLPCPGPCLSQLSIDHVDKRINCIFRWARIVATILVNRGIKVYLYSSITPTPYVVSYLVIKWQSYRIIEMHIVMILPTTTHAINLGLNKS